MSAAFARSMCATFLLGAFAACSGDVTSTAPAVKSTLHISANVSGTPINTIAVSVTADDIHEPQIFNFTIGDGGIASGTLEVSPGHARTFTAQGFDVNGIVTHEGSAVMDVVKGTNPPLALTMRPKTGSIVVTVTVASVGLIVSPAVVNVVRGATAQLTAQVTDQAAGGTIVGVVWASSNPAVATVSAGGVVTALTTGTANIVANYAGIASTSTVTVIDGSTIVFARAGLHQGIYAINSDGTSERQITSGPDFAPAWSPDHQHIAFASGRAGGGNISVWIMDANGNGSTQLTSATAGGTTDNSTLPAWSPDGTRIAFIRTTADGFTRVWIMTADGMNQALLDLSAKASFNETGVAWSSDGHLAVVEALTTPTIVSANADGTGFQQFITSSIWPAFSPDGSRLAFSSSSNPLDLSMPAQIYTRPFPSGPGTVVVTQPGTEVTSMPAWSPDGTQIVFVSSLPGAKGSSLYVANADGSGRVQLTSGNTDSRPSWR